MGRSIEVEALSRRLVRRQIAAAVMRRSLRLLRTGALVLVSILIIALSVAVAYQVLHYYRTGSISPLTRAIQRLLGW